MSASFSMRDTGTRLLLVGRTRLAASMLGRAVQADPTDHTAHHNLALALRAQGDHRAALEHAEASVRQAATAEGLTLLGCLRVQCGDRTGGEAALQQAASQDHAPAHSLLQALSQPEGLAPLPLSVEVLAAPLDATPSRPPAAAEVLTAAGLAAQLSRSRCAVALTGAGLSGSTRRQLWPRFHEDEAMSVWRFRENPVYLWSVISGAQDGPEATPGAAHRALAALPVSAVLTQGVDGLHQQAGSAEVVELHGALSRTRCDRCGRGYRVPAQGYLGGPLPPRCACGGPIRPDVLLFGEAAPASTMQAAARWLERADLLLVIESEGTELPRRAAASGARVVELRSSPSRLGRALGTARLPGPPAETLPAVLSALREIG